jgi:FHA domain
MSERRDAARRSARPPWPQRSRKRWTAAAGAAAGWLILLDVTGSAIAATMLLVVLGGLGIVCVLALGALGVTRDHPWIQRIAARPWRDGQDVLQLALRHLSEVFVITPSGSLLAPDLVELRMNPADLSSLCERMDLNVIAESVAEVYQDQVAAHGARFAGHYPAEVRVIADPAVPVGRYRLRQGQPVNASPQFFSPPDPPSPPSSPFPPAGTAVESMHPGPRLAHAGARSAEADSRAVYGTPHLAPDAPYPGFVGHDGNTSAQPGPGPATVTGMPTVIELHRSPVPALRLITGDSVTETRVSGARAGRGPVELRLPEMPTVSREHARFTFADGQWWIANLGRNGLTLNGTALVGEHPLGDGDSIRWGMRSDALLSKVKIG